MVERERSHPGDGMLVRDVMENFVKSRRRQEAGPAPGPDPGS